MAGLNGVLDGLVPRLWVWVWVVVVIWSRLPLTGISSYNGIEINDFCVRHLTDATHHSSHCLLLLSRVQACAHHQHGGKVCERHTQGTGSGHEHNLGSTALNIQHHITSV
jgi:hypothetical protein